MRKRMFLGARLAQSCVLGQLRVPLWSERLRRRVATTGFVRGTANELVFEVLWAEDGEFDEEELARDDAGVDVVEYSPDADLFESEWVVREKSRRRDERDPRVDGELVRQRCPGH